MPKIVTLAKQKGGVGCSTLALCLHFGFLQGNSDLKILLIDLDDQQSLLGLNKAKDLGLNVIDNIDTDKMNENDIVIIDTPPKLSAELQQAYELANIILIPSNTGIFDLISTIQAYNAIKGLIPDTVIFALLNRVNAVTQLNDKVLAEFETNNIPTLPNRIGNRLAYQQAMYETGNIYKTSNTKAKQEITELTNTIYSHLIK